MINRPITFAADRAAAGEPAPQFENISLVSAAVAANTHGG